VDGEEAGKAVGEVVGGRELQQDVVLDKG